MNSVVFLHKKDSKRKIILVLLLILTLGVVFSISSCNSDKKAKETSKVKSKAEEDKVVSISASGDMLYHPQLFWSVKQPNGTFNFNSQYSQIKPLIKKMDFALGDFEGCIAPNREYTGYPMFNAPKDIVSTIKNLGYDCIDLAHNHILDMGLDGLKSTQKAFNDAGIATVGVGKDIKDKIYIKNVKGIKIAVIGFCYGYNGMENTISKKDYNTYLDDLNVEDVKQKIKKAESLADITVVMPQLGDEYHIEPNEKQKAMYRNMVEWGADIIFGGHPHVPEPTEIIKKDGENKLILYSMGNLISNQRIETMGDTMNKEWTERGVIMQVNIQKKNGKTKIKSIIPHPTWVEKDLRGTYYKGFGLADYKVLLCEDYMPGGKYENKLSDDKLNRVRNSYNEVMKLMNVPENLLTKTL